MHPTTLQHNRITSYEWSARIRCDDSELDKSFSVHIFVGSVPENPSVWEDSPSYVGSKSFPHHGDGGRKMRNTVEGFVDLSDFLTDHAQLDSLSQEVVVPYLKREIHWRTQKVDDAVVPSTEFNSLEVVIICTPYTQGSNDPFPVPGTVQEYPSVTAGRPGGYRSR
ncbi:hypothetical protein FRC03_001637 [Tulasnella sp. 419]|nr:hypothetical protein FRC03_001637 [Tulasnella sp. 419]